MLRFVTKSELWEAMANGHIPKNPITYHLKYVQDVIAMREIAAYRLERGNSALCIGEAGANHSRILPDLAERGDRCFAVDVYDRSIGGGYTTKPEGVSYGFYECLMGESQGIIPDQHFDVLFSVSVVEHVPSDKLPAFFADNLRVLKPGGLMVHLIDSYVTDEGVANPAALAEYARVAWDGAEAFSPRDFRFSCAYATNPDNTMHGWNKAAPALAELRSRAQSCTLLLKAPKSS
jgi:SAM-dependent methyltransferase